MEKSKFSDFFIVKIRSYIGFEKFVIVLIFV